MATYDELMAAARKAKEQGNATATKRFLELALEARNAPPKAKTNVADQFSSGANEGIAMGAGTPVDAVTGLLNAMMSKPDVRLPINADMTVGEPVVTERGPAIPQAFGGSQTMLSAMDPLISDAAPETIAQRYARRIGQDVGYGAVAAPAIAATPALAPAAKAAPGAFYGTSAIGDVGSGIGGQTAEEIAPGNATANLIASMLGGAGATGLAASMMPKTPVRSIDSVKAEAAQAWDDIRAAPDALTPQATDDLRASVKSALPTGQLAPDAYPNAFRMAERMDDLQTPKVSDVVDMRRLIGDAVAADPKEARVGVDMKKAIAAYLDNIKPGDVTGGTGEIADDVRRANELSARGFRYDAVANKEMRGETRAATTGTGGNEVNATRQNIRTLFDKERDPTLKGARQGFTEAEMAAMGDVVYGTKTQNIARMLAGLAPNKGVLPMMGAMGTAVGGTAGYMSGNPLMALPMAIPAVGLAAKGISERSTQKAIAKLLETIANGGPVGPSAAQTAARAAIVEQLLSNAGQGQQR